MCQAGGELFSIIQCLVRIAINLWRVLLWSRSRYTVCFLFSFGQIFRAVLLLSEATQLALTASKIAMSIMCPQIAKGTTIVANSLEKRMLEPGKLIRPIISRYISMSRHLYDMNSVSTCTTPVNCFRVQYLRTECPDDRFTVREYRDVM